MKKLSLEDIMHKVLVENGFKQTKYKNYKYKKFIKDIEIKIKPLEIGKPVMLEVEKKIEIPKCKFKKRPKNCCYLCMKLYYKGNICYNDRNPCDMCNSITGRNKCFKQNKERIN